MPKAKKNNGANGVGHNSGEPLSDDDAAALHAYFETKVRAQRRKVEAAKIEAKAQTDTLNALFTTVRAEMRQTRKDFEDTLAKADMTEAEFRNSEAARTRRYALAGLPVGTQLELALRPDTVSDAIDAEANGFRAGRRGDDPIPPREVAPIMHQDWMKGWDRGQSANGELLGKAAAILAERGKPNPAPAVDLNAKGEGAAPDLDPSTIEAKAKALKRSGFTTKTPALEPAAH